MSQVQLQFEATTKQYSLSGLPQDGDSDDLDLEQLIGDFQAEEILGCLNHSLTVAELTEDEGHQIASIFNSADDPATGAGAVLEWMTANHADLMAGPAGSDFDQDTDY
jgi:hypothetical protein